MKAADIMSAMRQQLAPAVSTWSNCANDHCPGTARGGRECMVCLRRELIEACGSVSDVDSYISYQKMTLSLQSRIEELAKGGEA